MKTILWAVDPIQEPREAQNIVNELKMWTRQSHYRIQPVSIFSASKLKFFVNREKVANEITSRYLSFLDIQGFAPAKVIFTQGMSNREMVKRLIQHAKQQKAAFIFLNTRAKNKRNLFRLGSFAETLIALSPIPVVTLNPFSPASKKVASILFATDFSAPSKNALNRIIPIAKEMGAKIILYHQIEEPDYYYSSEIVVLTPNETKSMLEDERKKRQKKMDSWVRGIAEKGIKASTIIEFYREDVGAQIVEAAQKNNVDLISVATHVGPIARALIGSTARDVLVQAKCPVLIYYRPTAPKKKTTTKRLRHPRSHPKRTFSGADLFQ